MDNKELEKRLAKDINDYVYIHGVPRFLEFAAKVLSGPVDQKDLGNQNNEVNESRSESSVVNPVSMIVPNFQSNIGGVSIYDKEHLGAVYEDLMESSPKANNEKEYKTKVLEKPGLPNVGPAPEARPNPWGDAKIVSPGHFK